MLKNKKGQGMTEYIVIIAAVVIAFIAFWPKIKTALDTKTTSVVTGINSAGN